MKTFYNDPERRKATMKELLEYGFTEEQAQAIVMVIQGALIDDRYRRQDFYMKLSTRLMWFVLALVYAFVFFQIGVHFKGF